MNDEYYEIARQKAMQAADEHVRLSFPDKCTETQHQLCWQRRYDKEFYSLITPPRRDQLDIILDKLNNLT